ncbi:hypothetical protein RF11_07501 [Thelohanellus kitauei]|uniref:Uncharacterized protein n=1 Tax=Thelohanellus kitauei TaxID=669202 RepID=A0A0C2MB84_THEKT|nr:hypothetical protein RF11_07501 [Thelohanellus kitauei]
MRKEYSADLDDDFVVEFWETARTCLEIIFEKIQPEPYLNVAVSMIRSHPRKYIQIEPCIFFLSALIVDDSSYDLLHEVYQFILNLPPNVPPLLIQTSCEFLRCFILNRPKSPEDDRISFNSIYKWLAHLPIFASTSVMAVNEYDEDMFDDDILACDLLNRMLVLCQDHCDVSDLVRTIRDELAISSVDEPKVSKNIYEFIMSILLQEIQKRQDTDESADFTLFILAEILTILQRVKDELPSEIDAATIEKVGLKYYRHSIYAF